MSKDTMTEIKRQIDIKTIDETIKNELNNLKIKIENKRISKIYIVGSGDSYFSGLAAKNFVSSELDVVCLAVTSLEFEGYLVNQIDDSSLVIAISMSGNSKRTLTGVVKAQEKGAFVVGITNSTNGKLYNISNSPLFLDLKEEPGWTPGTLTYTGSIYTLLTLVIILLGDEKANEYLSQVKEALDFIDNNFEDFDTKAKEIAKNLHLGQTEFPGYILGGGAHYATAKYGAAKFLELCDSLVVGQETEEFAHQEFWIINKNAPVFIVSAKGKVSERAQEVADTLRYFGNDIISISNDTKFEKISKYHFNMPKNVNEYIGTLIYHIPLQLVSYHFSYLKGFNPDTRIHIDPFRKRVSRLLTRGSLNAKY